MNNNVNGTKKSSSLVNWITVWGFIFAVIVYNLYVDNRLNRNWYQTQYKAESQRADSLYAEKVRLEQRLREIESIKDPSVSTGLSPNSKGTAIVATSGF